MTITDPRQPVFIRKGKRYIAIGSLDNGIGTWDAWHSPGLWIHTKTSSCQSMSKIADLDQLPCPAVMFGAVAAKKDELMQILRDTRGESDNDKAVKILEWIAKGGES